MKSFIWLRPKYSNVPMYYEGREADVTWVPEPTSPEFHTRFEAKKAWLVGMKEIPEGDYSKHFINTLFAPFTRKALAQVRIGRKEKT